MMNTFFLRKETTNNVKITVIKKVRRPTIMYSGDTWTLTVKYQPQIIAT